jgi:hypothetical protein
MFCIDHKGRAYVGLDPIPCSVKRFYMMEGKFSASQKLKNKEAAPKGTASEI